jgi:hypothetical protein
MRFHVPVALAAALALVSSGAWAQAPADEFTPDQMAIACAPPPALGQPGPDALRVIGSQDPNPRSLFGRPERLVLNGGSAKGVQLGQQFFIRRLVRFGAGYRDNLPHLVHTAGWGRVVAVNDTTAIIGVDHACSDILQGDYVEAFEAPPLDTEAAAAPVAGQPDFSSLGRVLFGDDQHASVGAGQYILIDRGTEQGVAPGSQFAIYRDLHVSGVPLAAVGEATAVTIGARLALVRVTSTRDAVLSGDLAVPRTK